MIERVITSRAEISDIQMEGLKFFLFCRGAMDAVEGYLNTASEYAGGQGNSKFIPIFGTKPGPYQTEANVRFMESFMQTKL